MVLTKNKIISSNDTFVSLFTNLEEYLINFNIAKELFDRSIVKTDQDKALLIRYYDNSLERANRLVIDDEYVGITYDNLDIINSIINENKLVKRI